MIAQTAMRIRVQMEHFSGNLSMGLCKTARRFVGKAIYGIQAHQSVHLTELPLSMAEGPPFQAPHSSSEGPPDQFLAP